MRTLAPTLEEVVQLLEVLSGCGRERIGLASPALSWASEFEDWAGHQARMLYRADI